jgi:hypothetical protein
VAYIDGSNGSKATVKKFDGTNWVDVGTAVSSGTANFTSIAINSVGTPYVAYGSGGAFAKAFTTSVTLPLHFLHFTGSLRNGKAELSWQTEHEVNTFECIVERSTDGLHFNTVGRIASANTPGVHHYHFTDGLLNGATVYYYRIRQTDIDGRYSFSPVVKLKGGGGSSMMTVYPNPAQNEVVVTLSANSLQPIRVRVLDVNGRVLQSEQWTLQAGSTSRSLGVSTLAKGLYYIEVTGATLHQQTAIIKQ